MNRVLVVAISAALAAPACRERTDRSIPTARRSADDGRRSSTASASGAASAEGAAAAGGAPAKPANETDARGVAFVRAPPGDVPPIVRDASAAAAASGRGFLVYVGASWCEPCRRFHRAAEEGALDGALPKLMLLEFDLDRDRDRLVAAGYGSRFIPLFALASADGTASSHRIEGAIKGEGAVDFILPRLRELLTRRNPDGRL